MYIYDADILISTHFVLPCFLLCHSQRQLLAAISSTASLIEQEQNESYDVLYLNHFIGLYELVLTHLASGRHINELTEGSTTTSAAPSPVSTTDVIGIAEFNAFATKTVFSQIDLTNKGYVTKQDFKEVSVVVPFLYH